MKKEWYQSKSKWSALLLATGSLLVMGSKVLMGEPIDYNEVSVHVGVILGAVGLWGVRDAQD